MTRPLTDQTRNRRGCFLILFILLLFAGLYLWAGFSAEPGNNSVEDIQALPDSPS
jgi:hypothetical protein